MKTIRGPPMPIEFLRVGGNDEKPKKSKKPAKEENKSIEKKVKKKPIGPKPKYTSKEEAGKASRERGAVYKRKIDQAARDIYPLPTEDIDWTRRLRCKQNLQEFCETYLKPVFYHGWSTDQLECIEKLESVYTEDKLFALAMPRGGGKSALCKASIVWGTANGYKMYPFFIGANEDQALQTLSSVKRWWNDSDLLFQDFPEIAYPIRKLENRFHLTYGQLFEGESTYITWGGEEIKYPTLLLSKEQVQPYLDNDPEFVIYIEKRDKYILKSAGCTISTTGVGGSVRGSSYARPITLEQIRPDVVVLDDIQNDQKANSPEACRKLVLLIDGALQGMSGPGKTMAGIMPCTVMREGDVSDTYLDQTKKPEWQGKRCSMVTQWPNGIDNYKISMETPEGICWNKYEIIRKESLKQFGDLRTATEYYAANREIMDKDFKVSWEARYDIEKELSAQQHAMNIRFKNNDTFVSEFQNVGRRQVSEDVVMITVDEFLDKLSPTEKGVVPLGAHIVTAFIDIQDEILFWNVLASDYNYTSTVIDYGTWPEIEVKNFNKYQVGNWKLLTREFIKANPTYLSSKRDKIIPVEAKIYFALEQCLKFLKDKNYIKDDQHQSIVKIGKKAIDARWGQVSDTVKQFVKSQRDNNLHVYYGQSYPPTRMQLEKYQRRPGWIFESMRNPSIKEDRWVNKPNEDGTYYLSVDVNRFKDFIFSRLATPKGLPGGISLYNAPRHEHELYARHVCSSEFPVAVSANGMTKNQWTPRQDRPDNDWLDCLVGATMLTSMGGATLSVSSGEVVKRTPKGKSITDRWRKSGHDRINQM